MKEKTLLLGAPYPACGSSTAPPDQSYVATVRNLDINHHDNR